MKIKIEKSCGLPNKYNTGWTIAISPNLDMMWVEPERGDMYYGDNEPFLIISIGWLFWNWSFFIERLI